MPATITDRLNGLTTSVAIKAPCRVGSTGNLTLSGLQSIDGITVAAGDRVLVKDQTNTVQNGIYTASTGDWSRAADFDGSLDFVKGTMIFVHSGSQNNNTFWRVSSADGLVVGTDAIAFQAELGFIQSGVYVTPEAYGAVGDGVTDDTSAIRSAFGTDETVVFTGSKNYRITGVIDFAASGQKAYFNGCTITVDGNFNAFRITGGIHSCSVFDPIFEATDHTGGYLIYISNADRTVLRGIRGHDPYNFLYAEKFNYLHLEDVWINNVTGDYGVHLYGENSLRSDVAAFFNVTISSHTLPKAAIGLLVDGLVHTINIQTMKLLNFKNGVQYKNTSGGAVPMFLFADNLEIEFSLNDGIDLQVGEHFYFTNLYSVSSETGSGIKIDASVPSGRISITNGDIVDNFLYGIDNPSTRVQVSGLSMFDNLSGDFSGEAYVHAPIHQVDDDFYLRVLSSNPIINFAPTDYFEYDRATNRLFLRVGGSDRFAVNATGVEVYVNSAMKTIEVGAADSGGAGYRMLRVTN